MPKGTKLFSLYIQCCSLFFWTSLAAGEVIGTVINSLTLICMSCLVDQGSCHVVPHWWGLIPLQKLMHSPNQNSGLYLPNVFGIFCWWCFVSYWDLRMANRPYQSWISMVSLSSRTYTQRKWSTKPEMHSVGQQLALTICDGWIKYTTFIQIMKLNIFSQKQLKHSKSIKNFVFFEDRVCTIFFLKLDKIVQ